MDLVKTWMDLRDLEGFERESKGLEGIVMDCVGLLCGTGDRWEL